MSAPFEPTVIRVSSLTGYPDCERRGAARLFRREIEAAGFRLKHPPRGIGALIGSAVHAGVALELNEKAGAGKLPPPSVPIDCAVELLTEEIRRGEIMFDGPNGKTHTRGEALAQAEKMTRTYHFMIAPKVEPIRVETRLEAEIAPGLVLSGQPDLVAREPQSIRDLKTGVRFPGSFAPQLGGYSLLNRSHGLDIERASIDFIARVGLNKAQPAPVETQAEPAHAEAAASSIIKHMAGDLRTFREGDPERGIQPGDPWSFTANPSSILCSPKWCPAFGTEFCHEGVKANGGAVE